MKKTCFLLVTLFSSFSMLFAQFNPSLQHGQYNQVLKEGSTKVNYSKEELQAFEQNFESSNTLTFDNSNALTGEQINCDFLWQDAIFGTCIGNNNSLIPFDFDGEEGPELITNAGSGGFGNDGYWYVLKYNAINQSYEKIFVSELFESTINKLTLVDLNFDNTYELLVAVEDWLYIVDLETHETIESLQLDLSGWQGIRQVRYGDGDNDGIAEIIVSTDDDLIMIETINFEVEHDFSIDGGDFDLGNVDQDANLEIVFTHGEVLEVSGGSYISEYDFRIDVFNPSGFIELSDTDEDGKEEAFVADSWYKITAFDVELESPKFEISSDLDIDAFMMQDINGDGVEEVLYGDGQWGDIYCHDAQTGAQLWNINNPEHGTTGIAVADFDNDEITEVVWGAGCSSSGSDYLFFHNMENLNYEWQSIHIDGPYYAIEIEDVDEDGENEIITISYESESGYDSGILTIYDAVTKSIEFQSDGNFFGSVWTGIFNVEIGDYGNDGDLDILVAAGETYDGKLFVVDGNTYNLEQEYEYPFQADIDEFYALEFEDIDNDGTAEFLAANDYKMYIINSDNFAVEWESVTLSGFQKPTGLLTGNIDSDAGLEIVLAKNYIYTYDDENYMQSQSLNDQYYCIRLYDWDGDGEKEILAGLTTGFVQVLSGDLEILETFTVSTQQINGIEVADLNNDGTDELVVASENQVHFMTKTGDLISSQIIGENIGEYDAIVAKDYDNDGEINLIFGTKISLLEFDKACSQCLWYEASVEKIDPVCGDDNGQIIGISEDVSTIFSTQSLIFSDSLHQLGEGNYTITASNDIGCQKEFSLALSQQELIANTHFTEKTCFGPEDGMAFVNISEGAEPFNFLWSNGEENDTISNLPTGEYWVTVTDANNCVYNENIAIEQSILEAEISINKPSCQDIANGQASISILEGQAPYNFIWDTANGNANNNNLTPGSHSATVIDANGCENNFAFVIDSTQLLVETTQISASCNGEPDGSASVEVMDGVFPYFYSWSNGQNNNIINSASSGIYYVTVTDGNQCISVDSVTIAESVLAVLSESTDLQCFDDQNGSAVVFVTEGTPPFSYQWNNGIQNNSLSNLPAGNYFVLVQDSIGCQVVEQVEITSPPAFDVSFNINPDSTHTSELEGAIEVMVSGGTPPYFYNWDTGATSPSIDDLGEGAYTILITDINECIFETEVIIDVINNIEEAPNHLFKVFPNPTTDIVHIQATKLSSDIEIEIFSINGKRITNNVSIQQSSTELTLNLGNQTTGNYFILMKFADKSYYKMIEIVR